MSRKMLLKRLGVGVAGRTANMLHQSASYGTSWPALSLFVKRRDGYACQAHKIGLRRCFNVFPPPFSHLLHAHHIIPRAKGGPDKPHNLVTLCKDCHGLIHGRSLGKAITAKQKFAATRCK